MHLKKLIAFIVVSLLIILSGFGLYFYYQLSPAGRGQEKILCIERGESLAGTAYMLQKEGLIRSSKAFGYFARLTGSEEKIKFGEYKISPKQSSPDILKQLVDGRVYMHLITIPEGFTLKQIAKRLANEKIVPEEDFLYLASNNTDIAISDYTPPTLEGYLFPDSYYFSKDSPAKDVINTFVNMFKKKILPLYEAAKKDNDKLMSLEDIIKLASIVEAETQLDTERPVVASVYYNRLNKHILLQCDATIQYILSERKINIRYSDLAIDSPYNTYLYPGLPPTPICNPGIASVEACLYPEKTQFLYFVRNDKKGDGSHIFSKTYIEHLKAIDSHQLY
ncbi:MAG: endolytic transglycosylase MltG [Armatimonadota bacterium]